MPSVFDYVDFRRYLADYYRERKASHPSFSYQYLAMRAGFRNKGHVYNIIHGTKGMSRGSAFKLSKALKHNRYEAEYFGLLVAFNQASDHVERTELFERMQGIRHAGVPLATRTCCTHGSSARPLLFIRQPRRRCL